MSSIAYITEQRRIEFHRLNGDTAMNFWRPGKPRNFTDFNQGDFLFFLVKGSRREKGIAGYGKLKKETRYSVRKMWKEYQQLNGYHSEKELREDLQRMIKGNPLPKQIQGLYLEDVVFFQSPIYLSELGFKLSSKAEGYIYLDKDDKQITTRLLHVAKEHGVDMWTAALTPKETTSFEEDEVKHLISLTHKKIKDCGYSESEKRKARKLAEELVSQGVFEAVKGSKQDCIFYQSDQIIIAVPFVFNSKDVKLKAQNLLGHCITYQLEMKRLWSKPLKIRFKVISQEPLPSWIKRNIESLNEGEYGE